MNAGTDYAKNLLTWLQINPELRNFLPPLTAQERQTLVENIQREGIQEPVIASMIGQVWTLIAGHNRFEIAEQLGLPIPYIRGPAFNHVGDAMHWMLLNQLGRRNLSRTQIKLMSGRYYNTMANYATGGNTAEILAPIFKVAPRTIQRNAAFALLVDQLATVYPQIVESMQSETLSAKEETLRHLSELSPDRQRKAIDRWCIGEGALESYLTVPADPPKPPPSSAQGTTPSSGPADQTGHQSSGSRVQTGAPFAGRYAPDSSGAHQPTMSHTPPTEMRSAPSQGQAGGENSYARAPLGDTSHVGPVLQHVQHLQSALNLTSAEWTAVRGQLELRFGAWVTPSLVSGVTTALASVGAGLKQISDALLRPPSSS